MPHGQWSGATGSGFGGVLLVVTIALSGAVFLLPGAAIGLLLRRRQALDSLQFAAVTLVSSAAAAYAAFWPYVISARAGKAVTLSIAVCTIAVIGNEVRARKLTIELLRELAICTLLMGLVTTAYSAIGYLYRYSDNPIIQAQERFLHLPPDNIIPYVFAARLYHSVPVRPWLYGEWKSSDRPPLQTGATLLQLPLWKAGQREFKYQTLGTLLQSMWIAAVWILLRSAGVPRRTIVVVCAFCAASGTFLLFSFFVWPKLLAAALFILALSFLHFVEGKVKNCTVFEGGFAGVAVGLALLSHPGVAFTVLGLGVLLVATRAVPPLRQTLWGVLAVLVLIVPWMLYQKFYDPPGDHLLKWHLAGVREIDSRSFREVLVEAYTKPKVGEIVDAKVENIKTLWGSGPLEDLAAVARGKTSLQGKRLLSLYAGSNFFYLFQAVGLLNVGFLVLLVTRVSPARVRASEIVFGAQRLLALALIAIVIWCLIMYLPKSTLIHEGSLGNVLLLFVALGTILATAAPRLTFVLLAIQVLVFFPLYVVEKPFASGGASAVWNELNGQMALLGIASFAALIVLGWKLGWLETGSMELPRPGRACSAERLEDREHLASSKKAAERP